MEQNWNNRLRSRCVARQVGLFYREEKKGVKSYTAIYIYIYYCRMRVVLISCTCLHSLATVVLYFSLALHYLELHLHVTYTIKYMDVP